jgi:O-antigen/teichoic acid export membrane protein
MSASVATAAELDPQPAGLMKNSVARFASDGTGLILGTISAIVTARVLGPSDKGTLAVLTFVTLLAIQCCTLGLGDAAVVRVGQGKASAQRALSSSLAIVFASSLVGALVVLGYSALQIPLGGDHVRAAVATACATVVVATVSQILVYIVYATQRIMAVTILTIAMAVITTSGVLLFCWILDLGVFGGVLASLVAAAAGLACATVLLLRANVIPRPRLDLSYLRPALSFGLRAQLANVLAYSSARVDLLLVYAIAGRTQAGYYSVALTLGTITGFVAIALSYASFPRMTRMDEADALRLTTQLTRAGFAVGVVLGVGLSVALFGLIPLLLGSAYDGALWPAIVLLFGNVLWGGQWMLSRAIAARGDATLLLRSFGLNLAVMVVSDLILIPPFGALGAAIGSVLAPAAGLALCLWIYRGMGVSVGQLIPRPADLRAVQDAIRRGARAVRP